MTVRPSGFAQDEERVPRALGRLPSALWRDGDPVLVWQAGSATMHADLDPDIIAAAYEDVPSLQPPSTGRRFGPISKATSRARHSMP